MLEQLPESVNDVDVMFNAAKAWELLGDRESALEWLGRALESGYPLSKIEACPELEELRADERYRLLSQSGRARQ